MFVSSYNTYIYTDNSNKISKDSKETEYKKEKLKSFQHSLLKATNKKITQNPPAQINYISQGQVNYNKKILELQQQKDLNVEENLYKKSIDSSKKFNKSSSIQNASKKYSATTQKFSTFKKSKVVFNQSINNNIDTPKKIQDIIEQNKRDLMVSTYNENNNYYFSYH